MSPFFPLRHNAWLQGLWDAVCPQRCVHCPAFVYSDSATFPLCSACDAAYSFRPLVTYVNDYPFACMGVFEEELQHLVHAFKYEGIQRVGDYLADKMYAELARRGVFEEIDAIVAVPISRQRLWKRGFNQSEILAECLSKLSGIPHHSNSLRKIRHNAPQMELKKEERWANVEDAYFWTPIDNIENILLLDDVLTTGSTLLACVRAIKEQQKGLEFSFVTIAKAL